jgi:hypothetical protein
MSKCSDLLDVAVDSVVLTFDLLEDPAALAQKDLKRALRAKEVRAEMQKAFASAAEDVIKKHHKGKPVTEREAVDFLAKGGGVVGERMGRELSETLTCKLKESPLGVWIDRNEWVLYVVVPVVVAGGAYGAKLMYDARVGDTPASWATALAGKHLTFRPLGGLKIGATDIEFVPSKREVGVKLFVTKNWEKVEATLTFGGGMAEDELSKANAAASAKIPLGMRYKGVAGASTLDLSLKGFLEKDAAAGGTTYGGSASATLKTDLGPLPTSLTARGEWKNRGTGGGGPEYGVYFDVELLTF